MAARNSSGRPLAVVLMIGASVIVAGVAACAAEGVPATQSAARQLEHPKVSDPATLTGPRAESVYQAIRGQMRANYIRAGDPVALAYQQWRRFNRTPYRSANHGERFVNHYGNAKAAGYARFESLDPLPVGAIVIKDSFTVTRNGDLTTGPLFMMEKMPAGFPSLAGTWRFMMLRPDGAMAGITDGPGGGNVRFCESCHRDAGAARDYLFFLPKRARPGGG